MSQEESNLNLVATKTNGRIAFYSAAALAVGSFLPWVKGTAPFIGTVSYSGMEGGDGIFTLIAAGLVLLLGFRLWNATTPKVNVSWAWIVFGLLTALLIYEVGHISNAISGGPEAGVAISYGAGIWLCVAGGTGLLVCLIRASRNV